ncbi:MAG: YoaK family protein, partial [Stellaceae bacterium]
MALAALMAALAGMVDGIGFLRLGHLYVSYMSGNSTQMAIDAGRLRLGEAGAILVLIGLFVIGAAGGQILAHLFGRRHLTAVLAVVMVLLAVSAALDTATKPMVLAMGALNAAMHRAGNVPVNLTFVTGTLVRFGQGLGDFAIGRPSSWVWLQQAVPWLG